MEQQQGVPDRYDQHLGANPMLDPGRVMAEPRDRVSSGQVNSELARLAAELDQLHGAITGLESRLEPVCVNDDSIAKESEPREVLVSLASSLRDCFDAAAAATNRLSRLNQRIEL